MSAEQPKTPPSERQDRITAVSIRGFKSLYNEVSVDFRPLTIFAGANSSGKSSVMQTLLLLKQTIEAPYDPGSLLIDGPNVRFTSARQILSRTPRGLSVDTFTIQIEAGSLYKVSLSFKRPFKRPLEAAEMRVSAHGEKPIVLKPGMAHTEIVASLPESLSKLAEAFKVGTVRPTWRVARNRGFLQFEMVLGTNGAPIQLPGEFLQIAGHRLLVNHLRRIVHVPGLRGDPQRTQKTTAVGSEFPGTFESYVASVINHWQETKNVKLNRVGKDLERLGLTWRVDARRVDDTRVELRVSRLPTRDSDERREMISVADVGFGVSQILPVLVALHVAEKGQMVYVEQPEIHLHPRAQFVLAEMLVSAAKRGVQLVVETHSSLLLLGVQTLVAEKRIRPERVRLHWFSRDLSGSTKIASAQLDDAGRFGDWPEDFDVVSLDAERRFLDAVDDADSEK